MLLCCAFRKQRLYLFTRREPEDAEEATVGHAAGRRRLGQAGGWQGGVGLGLGLVAPGHAPTALRALVGCPHSGRGGGARQGAGMLLTRLALGACLQIGRDVFNEKPAADDVLAAAEAGAGMYALPRGAVLHTTKGDIVMQLFPDECPRTVRCVTRAGLLRRTFACHQGCARGRAAQACMVWRVPGPCPGHWWRPGSPDPVPASRQAAPCPPPPPPPVPPPPPPGVTGGELHHARQERLL